MLVSPYRQALEIEMYEFTVEKMSCGHCIKTVTQAVRGCDINADVNVDLATKRVGVKSTAAEADLRTALAKAGYPARAS
jgi:copper chaperone